jgi:hypothetical protein
MGGRLGRFASFWCDDLPPLDGRLRAVVVGLLFLRGAATPVSPLYIVELQRCLDDSLYAPVGVMAMFGPGMPSAPLLVVLRAALVVCWLAAAAGLLWRFTAPATAILFATAYGFLLGNLGAAHFGHLEMYAFGCLCFARSRNYSLDIVLARRWRWYARLAGEPSRLARTGFARKCVLVCASFVLFDGGLSKLLEAGPRWADGVTLRTQIAIEPFFGVAWRSPATARLLMDHPHLAAVASGATLALELGAPVALFSRAWRHAVFPAAALFHAGIFLVMLPDYWPSVIVYALVIDWGVVGSWLSRKHGAAVRDTSSRVASSEVRPGRAAPEILAGAVATLLACALAAVGAGRVEYFPVSRIPMYAEYVSPDSISGVELASLRDEATLQRVAARALRDRSLALTYAMSLMCRVEIVDPGASRAVELVTVAPTGAWERSFGRAVLEDLAAKPEGDIRADGEAYPMASFLARHRATLLGPTARRSTMPQVRPESLPAGFRPDRLACVCTPGAFLPADRAGRPPVVIGTTDAR